LLEESDKLSFLSPRLVQAFAKEILASFKSENIVRLTKQILATVLDKYSGGQGIHPSYVYTMYQDIQSQRATDVSDLLLHLKVLEMGLVLDKPKFVYSNPELRVYSDDHTANGFNKFRNLVVKWETSSCRVRSQMDLSLLALVSVTTSEFLSTPKRYLITEIAPCPPLHTYKKIQKVYPRVFVERDDGTTLTFHTIEDEVVEQVVSTPSSPTMSDRKAPKGKDFRRASFLGGKLSNAEDFAAVVNAQSRLVSIGEYAEESSEVEASVMNMVQGGDRISLKATPSMLIDAIMMPEVRDEPRVHEMEVNDELERRLSELAKDDDDDDDDDVETNSIPLDTSGEGAAPLITITASTPKDDKSGGYEDAFDEEEEVDEAEEYEDEEEDD
jgi:hypothetical protein